jgi:hypothetical protein
MGVILIQTPQNESLPLPWAVYRAVPFYTVPMISKILAVRCDIIHVAHDTDLERKRELSKSEEQHRRLDGRRVARR